VTVPGFGARLIALALAACIIGGEAHAQAFQCRVPEKAPQVPLIAQDGPTRRLTLTGYTLALSWSPEFCRTRKTSTPHARQCGGQNGRFGFILHGLWPEGAGGSWPQWCMAAPRPAPATIRQNLCIMPSARLMAHEWAKHGSCMTRKPATYFKVSSILWHSLRFPDFDQLSRRKGLNAGAVREAFVLANPGWRGDQIGISLNRKGWLEGLQLCYGKNFMPARCEKRRLGAGNKVQVKIWRGL
jgi:ribonuclease T2